MRWLLVALLAACSVPDEIGVGLGASQYDYLGSGDSTWPLTDSTGNEFGAHVWASWQMRPQRMIMMRPEEAVTFEPAPTPVVAPQPITINTQDEKAAEDSTLDDIGDLGEKAKDWPVLLQVGAMLGMFGAIIGALYLLVRKVKHS